MRLQLHRRWALWRERLRRRRAAEFVYRIAVAVVGLAVLAVGIVAIPYPGPGWAIVFVGLAILATEFAWARRVLSFANRRYDIAMAGLRRQSRWVQAAGVVFTATVVLVTLWLLGAVGWAAALAGCDWPWLKSPIGVGS